MNKALFAQLMQLSPAERIELVHDLWDSIPPGESASLNAELLGLSSVERIELAQNLWDIAPEDLPPLTDEQMAEIEKRSDEHQRDPASAIPWEEARARLWSRYG